MVCVALARWPSGRTRIVLGGLAGADHRLDGEELEGAAEVVEYALITAQDQWASAEYRIDAAKTLVGRCFRRSNKLKIKGIWMTNLHGFELLKAQEIPELNSNGKLYRHPKQAQSALV